MNLKEKVVDGLMACKEEKSIYGAGCYHCPYTGEECDGSADRSPLVQDTINIIKSYDFALKQYKETLEELIENNDGDVKEICVFLLNLLRIKEIDIEKGFYI